MLVDKAREVVEANRAAGRRIAVAESCTGGLVSAALTEIPGSSDVFEAGYVTYSNAAKISRARGQSSDVVETFGAVSVATAWAMARGRARSVAAPMSRWRSPASPARRRNAAQSRSARWSSPAPSAMPIRRRSSPTRNCSTSETRSGVRLQAALCALELLMP